MKLSLPVSAGLFTRTLSGDRSRPRVVPIKSSRHMTSRGLPKPGSRVYASYIGPWQQRGALSVQPMTR